jgi:hypothetical protein
MLPENFYSFNWIGRNQEANYSAIVPSKSYTIMTYKDVNGGKIPVGEKIPELIKFSGKSDRLPDRIKDVS